MVEVNGTISIIATIIVIIVIIILLLFIWACLTLSRLYDDMLYEELEEQEVGNMNVEDALQLVIKALEDNATCGRLGEKLRIAKLTLKKYVEEKIIEDRKNQEKE